MNLAMFHFLSVGLAVHLEQVIFSWRKSFRDLIQGVRGDGLVVVGSTEDLAGFARDRRAAFA